MIKAVFFDIDGTLLSFVTHQVSVGTVEACRRLNERGIKVFISTGRPKIIIPSLPIQIEGYVTMNGGLCWWGDEMVYSAPIPHEDAVRWLRFAKEHKVPTMSITKDKMYGNMLTEPVMAIHKQLKFKLPPIVDEEDIIDEEFYQFIGVFTSDKDARVCEMLPHCSLPRWHPAFSDIVLKGGTKAIGIEKMLEKFGWDRSEIMTFGDGRNDIEMLEYAGIGVAMGNAADVVKQHADYVTTDVDHEGVLHALTDLKII